MPGVEVGADELLFAAERAVERSLGDAGTLDDAIDPDRLDALGVEKLARRVQQPLPRRALRLRLVSRRVGGGGHGALSLNRVGDADGELDAVRIERDVILDLRDRGIR